MGIQVKRVPARRKGTRTTRAPARRAIPQTESRRQGAREPDRRRRGVPLVRALSKLGVASRRETEAMLAAGRVSVDGTVVGDPWMRVVPETAAIAIDGERVGAGAVRTIIFHKPRGLVTTRVDPAGRATVYTHLGTVAQGLICVGRLDLASSGLLILTNDTRLADWITDPDHGVPRVYLVTVRGALDEASARQICSGIEDAGEVLRARAVTIRKRSKRETHLVVTLTEGRNREIRRMMAALGHSITRLKRVSLGGLSLGDLATGAWRDVTESELRAAFPGAPSSWALPRPD